MVVVMVAVERVEGREEMGRGGRMVWFDIWEEEWRSTLGAGVQGWGETEVLPWAGYP